MDGRTHTFAGYTAGLLLVQAQINGLFELPAPEGLLPALGMVGLSMAGSLAPDIDLPCSKAGRKNKPVSAAVNALFGHRGITHAPFIWATLYAALRMFLGIEWLPYILAFVIGGATHILLDLFNKAGVPLLWPISHRFWIFGIKTDGASGHTFSFILACVAILCTISFVYEYGDFFKEAIRFV